MTFRVWAPNASSVFVAGDFNGWSTNATALVYEGANGAWSVDVAGASTGQQYKYYIPSRSGSKYAQDPRSRRQESSTGNCYVYNTTNFNWTGDTFTNVPLNDLVIYELDIASFNNLNSGDGNPGTFATATNRLGYLKQLGISAVEVMPICEFPGNFSWGYNPSDLFGVENSYGGPDGFKAFVKACHQQGIAVILDVVHNHYGLNDLDLWQFDGWSQNGYGGIYFYNTSPFCCTTWGDTRPNYGTQQVRDFIQDNFRMWLDECHVDGFRWDSPGTMMYANGNYIADGESLIRQISSMIHTSYTGKINIGEDRNDVNGTSGFDATWNGNTFFNNVAPQLTTANDSDRNMGAIDYAVNLNHNGGGLGSWGSVLFLETHDLSGDLNTNFGAARLPIRINSGDATGYYARKRSTLGAAITLTTPGLPMILQGQEMLTTNIFGADEVDAMIWSKTNTYSYIVSLYTDLIRLRRNLDGRSSGLKGVNVSTMWQDNGNKLIAYRRWDSGASGDDVVVIANFANTTWPSYNVPNFPKSGTWYTHFNSDLTKYGADYSNVGSTFVNVAGSTGTISIGPYSVLILSQVAPAQPVANFTGSPTNGVEILPVTFSDLSSGTITNRFWNFGDGGTTNVITNSVLHYYAAGTNHVTLTVYGLGGNSTLTRSNYVRASIYIPTPFQNWQVQYFGSTNNPAAAANADPDGDGQNNTAEFGSGTVPTNNASAFRIVSVAPEGNKIRITWSAVGGKTNWVQASAGDLINNSPSYSNYFFDMSSPIIIPGSGNVVTNFLDDGTWWGVYSSWPAHYYRVRVTP